MTYISLYRKYRPRKFNEVVGQDVVKTVLKNGIVNNKISHAYIFSGPRGTGKTSIAKIFAKAVNCLDFKDDLCDKCEICKTNIDEEIDIIEIDAASNNGVDEIREIRNNVKLMPVKLKYKVYIIDEVHMLSTSAFNALLKTLEEPPKHVIFILATTEMNKIPTTVLSRCQKFDFKKLTQSNIEKQLTYILECEDKTLPQEIVKLIAKLSDGGMRDAINMLDQVLSINKENVTSDDIYELIGEISEESVFNLFNSIINCDIKECLKYIDDYYEQGKNFVNISDRLQILTRNIIIYNNTENYFSKEYEEKLSKYTKISMELCSKLSDELFQLMLEIKKSNNQKTLMEIYFIKMCLLFDKNNIQEKNVTTEEKLEPQVKNVEKERKIDQNEAKFEELDNKRIRINNSLYNANKTLKNEFIESYSKINEYVSTKEYNAIANLLLKATPEVIGETNILFTFVNNFEVVLFDRNIEDIEKFLKTLFEKKYSVVAITNEEWNIEKKKYIQNINNNYKYEYIEEKKSKKQTKKTTVLENTAEDIFGDDIITVE